jgi:hypothetical protein
VEVVENQALREAIDRVMKRVTEQAYGSIKIREATAWIGEREVEDAPALRFEFVVSSPRGSEGAWATDDVFRLRSAVWDALAQEGIYLTPAVDLIPDKPDEEGDANAGDDLARALDERSDST